MFNLECEIQVKSKHPAQRQYAKAITFGIMYQAGPAKIAETVNKDATPGEEIIFHKQRYLLTNTS